MHINYPLNCYFCTKSLCLRIKKLFLSIFVSSSKVYGPKMHVSKCLECLDSLFKNQVVNVIQLNKSRDNFILSCVISLTPTQRRFVHFIIKVLLFTNDNFLFAFGTLCMVQLNYPLILLSMLYLARTWLFVMHHPAHDCYKIRMEELWIVFIFVNCNVFYSTYTLTFLWLR